MMDHPCQACPVCAGLREMAGMAFREVLVTEVFEVLRAWLAGAGKRPAAARAGCHTFSLNQRLGICPSVSGAARGRTGRSLSPLRRRYR